MLQLGMDSEGAQLRAKMQSASLLSDMESFKAANPGAVLADFVRWHSPRDWDSEKVCYKSKISKFLQHKIWDFKKNLISQPKKGVYRKKFGKKTQKYLLFFVVFHNL